MPPVSEIVHDRSPDRCACCARCTPCLWAGPPPATSCSIRPTLSPPLLPCSWTACKNLLSALENACYNKLSGHTVRWARVLHCHRRRRRRCRGWPPGRGRPTALPPAARAHLLPAPTPPIWQVNSFAFAEVGLLVVLAVILPGAAPPEVSASEQHRTWLHTAVALVHCRLQLGSGRPARWRRCCLPPPTPASHRCLLRLCRAWPRRRTTSGASCR